jgi:hypothetical protein
MRLVIGIVAALMVLGLAAFGLVSQREAAPFSLAASNSRGAAPPNIASPVQNHSAWPVSQISEAAASASIPTTPAPMAQGAAPHFGADAAGPESGRTAQLSGRLRLYAPRFAHLNLLLGLFKILGRLGSTAAVLKAFPHRVTNSLDWDRIGP